jgi:hypothetical protein
VHFSTNWSNGLQDGSDNTQTPGQLFTLSSLIIFSKEFSKSMPDDICRVRRKIDRGVFHDWATSQQANNCI